jgi:hypothetical protein
VLVVSVSTVGVSVTSVTVTVVVWRDSSVVTSVVSVGVAIVRFGSESILSSRKKDFVDNVNDTIARDDVLAEGFSVGSGSFILVDIDDEVILGGEFRLSENVVWNSNGGLEAVHHVSRSKLLTASSADTSGLRSLSVSLVLVSVDGAVSLATSEVLGQSSLWKNVKFQESLGVDSVEDTVNLGKGSVGRGEDGVGRVTGRHESQDIRILIDEITENSEVVTNTGIEISISSGVGGSSGTGAKVTVSTSAGTTLSSIETVLAGASTNIFGQFTSVEGDASLPGNGRGGKKSRKDYGEGRALEDGHVE